MKPIHAHAQAWWAPCLFALALLIPGLGSAQVIGPSPGAPIPAGYRTVGCSTSLLPGSSFSELRKVHEALGLLLQLRESGAGAFQGCMASAPFWESRGGCTPNDATYALVSTEFVEITCADLPMDPAEGTAVLGQARLYDTGRMDLSHYLLENFSPRDIAATIVHEIMHTRGYDHQLNPWGTPNYPLTVPEQAEACFRWGRPNAGTSEPGYDEAWRKCRRRAL
jgi:hypothetical protein